MLPIQMREPLGALDPLGKQVPQEPVVRCVGIAVLATRESLDDVVDLARMPVDGVEYRLEDLLGIGV